MADCGSDLDLVVTLAGGDGGPARTDEVARAAVDALDPIITIPIPRLSGSAYTCRSGLRCDVVVEDERQALPPPHDARLAVFDRAGLATTRTVASNAAPLPSETSGPNQERVLALVTEFYRQLAIFPAAVVAREDWLLGQEAVHNDRVLLYELFVAANAPLPAMGLKQWSRKLTADQRAVLAGLLPPVAERDSVVAGMGAASVAFRAHGRTVLSRAGGRWPDDVDDAVHAYWVRSGLADAWP